MKIEAILAPTITMPQYQSREAAGIDLHADLAEPLTIWPGTTTKIPSGLRLNLSGSGVCALVLPRSGISTSQGLAPINTPGLIDADYHGVIHVPLHNHSDEPRLVRPGDRIAQLLLVPYISAQLTLVEQFSATTERGESGFGSTGVAA